MLCRRGDGLLVAYRSALLVRANANANVTARPGADSSSGEISSHAVTAKRRYNEAFFAWMTHRGLWSQCRCEAVSEDQELLRSF